GYRNEIITDSNGFVTETINLEWVSGMEKFRYFEKDTLLLNNDGTYHTLIRQRWDDFNELWYNYEKHLDVEYLNYYGYPSHIMNDLVKRKKDLWENNDWINYSKDSISYLDENLNSSFLNVWLWDGNPEWIHYLSYRYLCYEDGSKRRATRWEYDGQQLALTYDDSITYAYYKGAPCELLRVQLDIPTGTWYPASRALYSEFVPLVISGSGIGMEFNKQPQLKIIPNPASNSVKIESEEQLSQVTILNGQGGVVLQKSLKGQEKSIHLSLGEWKPGIYIINSSTTSGTTMSGKLIVQ
ncbi:MAG: T9SS type A sorting domain-containing protein, partial [Bacteroidales bacterium]